MIELLKIDPYIEAVYLVTVGETLTEICQQLGARRLTIAGQQSLIPGSEQCPDAAYCDEEALRTVYIPPAFRLRNSGHVIYGCALWHRTTETGRLCPPAWSLAELTQQVEFLGFYLPFPPSTGSPMTDDESIPLDGL
ncbi:hypothetical protein [Spirosoma knui]